MKSDKFKAERYLKLLDLHRKMQKLSVLDKPKFEKCKFYFISKLVKELFKHKNSRDCFVNISNLIITFLNAFEDHYSIDIYSDYNNNESHSDNDYYRNILKSAF
ncbi:MAG TPA: hypothetical protein VGB37_10325 [Candidatus Lokiarchaeia archaeon]